MVMLAPATTEPECVILAAGGLCDGKLDNIVVCRQNPRTPLTNWPRHERLVLQQQQPEQNRRQARKHR
jgi:hypothetical protein